MTFYSKYNFLEIRLIILERSVLFVESLIYVHQMKSVLGHNIIIINMRLFQKYLNEVYGDILLKFKLFTQIAEQL